MSEQEREKTEIKSDVSIDIYKDKSVIDISDSELDSLLNNIIGKFLDCNKQNL